MEQIICLEISAGRTKVHQPIRALTKEFIGKSIRFVIPAKAGIQ